MSRCKNDERGEIRAKCEGKRTGTERKMSLK